MVKKILNNFLNILENNEYVILYLTSLIILYICFLDKKIPTFVENIFKNKIFKMIAILLILFRAQNNTFMSIMFTLAFLITIDKSSVNKTINMKSSEPKKENFSSNKKYTKEDTSYKNLINKLVKMKEHFTQDTITKKYTVLDCSNTGNTWSTFDKDIEGEGEDRLLHYQYRCTNNKDGALNPENLLEDIEELDNRGKTRLRDGEINRYNIFRKLFKDYKDYENNNQDKIKKLNWIKDVTI
jgi:hypothetical protein